MRQKVCCARTGLLAVVGTVLVAGVTLSGDQSPEPGARWAGWTELSFKARKLLLSATATIRVESFSAAEVSPALRPISGDGALSPAGAVVVVSLISDLPFGRLEQMTTWVEQGSGRVLQSEKLNTGSKQYWKLWRFSPQGYYLWRSEPRGKKEAKAGRDEWSKRSEGFRQYTTAVPEGMVVTDPYALLYLIAISRLDREGAALVLTIYSREQLVELRFEARERSACKRSYEIVSANGEHRRVRSMTVRRVVGTARALDGGGDDEDVDIGFLGMQGGLTIFVEEGTGVPVEVVGRSKGIGHLSVGLERLIEAP